MLYPLGHRDVCYCVIFKTYFVIVCAVNLSLLGSHGTCIPMGCPVQVPGFACRVYDTSRKSIKGHIPTHSPTPLDIGCWYLSKLVLLNMQETSYGTRCSQAVPHPSTIPARRCLTSVIRRERVCSSWYGRRQQHYFWRKVDRYMERELMHD